MGRVSVRTSLCLLIGVIANVSLAWWFAETFSERGGYILMGDQVLEDRPSLDFYPPERWPGVFGRGWQAEELVSRELDITLGHEMHLLRSSENWHVAIERDGVERWRQRTAIVVERASGWPFKSFHRRVGWITTQEFDYRNNVDGLTEGTKLLAEPFSPGIREVRIGVVPANVNEIGLLYSTLNHGRETIPMVPMPLGFITNSLIYSLLAWFPLLAVPRITSRFRVRADLEPSPC